MSVLKTVIFKKRKTGKTFRIQRTRRLNAEPHMESTGGGRRNRRRLA